MLPHQNNVRDGRVITVVIVEYARTSIVFGAGRVGNAADEPDFPVPSLTVIVPTRFRGDTPPAS